MHQRFIQSIVFIFTAFAGIYTTSLVNASADWFVDKYFSDPWIDILPAISLSRNCDPLLLVLSYDEVYAGKDKLGTYDKELRRFEDVL